MGKIKIFILSLAIATGGGISSINAVELRDKCNTNGCSINGNIPLLTNHNTFIYKSIDNNFTDGIYFEGTIDLFINHGTITTYYQDKLTTHSFSFVSKTEAGFNALINYGYISGGVSTSDNKSIHITNYGVMGGVDKGDITLTNYGVIKPLSDNGKKYHFKNVNLVLQDYAMMINVDSAKFNAFDGNAKDNSHLVLDSVTSVNFADKNSKMILDFGSGFELGAGYKLDKLIVKADKGENALGVDFDRLMPKSDIYTLYKQGDYFIARLQPQHSAISNIYKANIHTMNNFQTMSDSMIYPRKLQNLGKKNQNNIVILRERSDRRISKEK